MPGSAGRGSSAVVRCLVPSDVAASRPGRGDGDAGLDGDLDGAGPDGLAGAGCLGRLLIGHALAEAGQPPGGDVGGGEEEHRQAQAALAAARYPALSRVQQANIVHDPRRIFELALDGLILALQAHHPHD